MSEAFNVGEIRAFPYTFVPYGWKACDGSELYIHEHQTLFGLIGTTYGGDGRTTFKVPDLRNHCIIGAGQGPGLTNRQFGKRIGQSAVALSADEMPAHSHAFQVVDGSPESTYPDNANMIAGPVNGGRNAAMIYGDKSGQANMPTGTITSTGSGQPHENCQPFLRLQYCILVGS